MSAHATALRDGPVAALPRVLALCACRCGRPIRASTSWRTPRFLPGHKPLRGLPLRVLHALASGPLSTIDLRERLDVCGGTLHAALHKPRSYGFVEGHADPENPRAAHVYGLTDRGRALVEGRGAATALPDVVLALVTEEPSITVDELVEAVGIGREIVPTIWRMCRDGVLVPATTRGHVCLRVA